MFRSLELLGDEPFSMAGARTRTGEVAAAHNHFSFKVDTKASIIRGKVHILSDFSRTELTRIFC